MHKVLLKLSIAFDIVAVSCAIAEGAVPIPHVEGPLADAKNGALVWQVEREGYIAEEYFISGRADTYEPVGMADAADMFTRDNNKDAARRESYDRVVLKAQQPYVTRIIVYKPKNVAQFSGNVVAEVAHPNDEDSGIVWSLISGYFMSHGDICVIIQHPASFDIVRKYDRSKYGTLSAVDSTQIWGMIAQIGALIKSDDASSPLRHYPVKALFLTGYSHTGALTADFADYHHKTSILPDGRPIFDGYIPVGVSMYVRPLPVPVIRLNTQSDFYTWGGLETRRDDSDSPDSPFRIYEVAGAAHMYDEDEPIVIQPGAEHPVRKLLPPANFPQFDEKQCTKAGPGANDLPLSYVMAGAFENMYAWVRTGTKPPHAPWIQTNLDGSPKTDSSGNVLGGLRLPEIAVPAAAYGVDSGPSICFLYGYRATYSMDRMKTLYGSRAHYLEEVAAKAKELVEQHWLRRQEADAIVEEAKRVPEF